MRDTLENYISSIMLSLRQPFRAGESVAIHTTRLALEQGGFTLPEPIYRLRLDNPIPLGKTGGQATPEEASTAQRRDQAARRPPVFEPIIDGHPETHLDEKITEERARDSGEDLLDGNRPVE